MNTKNIRILGLTILLITLSNCSNNGMTSVKIDDQKQLVLMDIGNSIIVETYKDMDIAATALMSSINDFVATPTDAKLNTVREKWIATRTPWESSEGFLFGPADTKQLDPSLDSWPVDISAMNKVIASNEQITAELLAKNNDARGYHLIEYLVWGENGDAKAADLDARTLEYLKAAGQDLQKNAKELYNSWNAKDGNYVANLTEAHQGKGVYKSATVAIEEITGAIIAICDEVGNSKIATPLNISGAPKPEEEESRFSNNSKQDFQDNIQSVYNVYNGVYKDFKGNGLSVLTQTKDTALDTQIKGLIDEALASIKNIPGTFSEAIKTNKTEVENAVKKINELQKILEEKLNPLLKSL